MTVRALITGITGQDGSYLAELLLDIGYEVHGVLRRSSTFNTSRIDHIFDRLHLHHGDVTDGSAMRRIVADSAPSEIYNLAAQSHVRVSFDQPEYTADATGVGSLKVLECYKEYVERTGKECRFYQASSSEMYGRVVETPQTETTPFRPRSPYACAKVFAHSIAVNYREAYGLPISCGILFNHESPRRGETFVTRKVTKAAARIRLGRQKELRLGNLDAMRDWGFAGDYVKAMHLMLQADVPDDYVIATGESNSVRRLCEEAFAVVGLDYREYVVEDDPKYHRPSEVDSLLGDPSKARRELGWQPEMDFSSLVRMMVLHDVQKERAGRL